jgi:hypothetical protein
MKSTQPTVLLYIFISGKEACSSLKQSVVIHYQDQVLIVLSQFMCCVLHLYWNNMQLCLFFNYMPDNYLAWQSTTNDQFPQVISQLHTYRRTYTCLSSIWTKWKHSSGMAELHVSNIMLYYHLNVLKQQYINLNIMIVIRTNYFVGE